MLSRGQRSLFAHAVASVLCAHVCLCVALMSLSLSSSHSLCSNCVCAVGCNRAQLWIMGRRDGDLDIVWYNLLVIIEYKFREGKAATEERELWVIKFPVSWCFSIIIFKLCQKSLEKFYRLNWFVCVCVFDVCSAIFPVGNIDCLIWCYLLWGVDIPQQVTFILPGVQNEELQGIRSPVSKTTNWTTTTEMQSIVLGFFCLTSPFLSVSKVWATWATRTSICAY